MSHLRLIPLLRNASRGREVSARAVLNIAMLLRKRSEGSRPEQSDRTCRPVSSAPSGSAPGRDYPRSRCAMTLPLADTASDIAPGRLVIETDTR